MVLVVAPRHTWSNRPHRLRLPRLRRPALATAPYRALRPNLRRPSIDNRRLAPWKSWGPALVRPPRRSGSLRAVRGSVREVRSRLALHSQQQETGKIHRFVFGDGPEKIPWPLVPNVFVQALEGVFEPISNEPHADQRGTFTAVEILCVTVTTRNLELLPTALCLFGGVDAVPRWTFRPGPPPGPVRVLVQVLQADRAP